MQTILVIDDDESLRDTIGVLLEQEGFKAVLAGDGRTGYELALKLKPELILVDLRLPAMNGTEVCKQLRTSGIRTPIVVLSAIGDEVDKVLLLELGADDYMVKPFGTQELLMKIRVLLKRTLNQNVPVGTVLKASDLEMNLESKEVKRSNTVINLTAKEFQLLEYLMRNKNRVVSRSDIAVNVWDIDFDTNTNVIDVYINYVRNKVDKKFEPKLIHTQVGMGYILKDNS